MGVWVVNTIPARATRRASSSVIWRDARSSRIRSMAHRQLFATVLRIDLELPPAGVDVLASEALPVQKADGDERKAEVAGGLQVVAGEYAEAARVDRQALGDAELQREVGDGERRLRVHEAWVTVVVLVVRLARGLERLLDLLALAGFLDACFAQLRQQEHRVFSRRLPQFGVQSAEESFYSRLPGPQQVVGELLEFLHSPRGLPSGSLAGFFAPLRPLSVVDRCPGW